MKAPERQRCQKRIVTCGERDASMALCVRCHKELKAEYMVQRGRNFVCLPCAAALDASTPSTSAGVTPIEMATNAAHKTLHASADPKKYACGKCERLIEKWELVENQEGPMLCPSCAAEKARVVSEHHFTQERDVAKQLASKRQSTPGVPLRCACARCKRSNVVVRSSDNSEVDLLLEFKDKILCPACQEAAARTNRIKDTLESWCSGGLCFTASIIALLFAMWLFDSRGLDSDEPTVSTPTIKLVLKCGLILCGVFYGGYRWCKNKVEWFNR